MIKLTYFLCSMSPIFKCLVCRKDIERSTKTFWVKKGHLLCSTCLDNIEKKSWDIRLKKIWLIGVFLNNPWDILQKNIFCYSCHKNWWRDFFCFFLLLINNFWKNYLTGIMKKKNSQHVKIENKFNLDMLENYFIMIIYKVLTK